MKHFCGKVRGWETEGRRNGGGWTQRSEDGNKLEEEREVE